MPYCTPVLREIYIHIYRGNKIGPESKNKDCYEFIQRKWEFSLGS